MNREIKIPTDVEQQMLRAAVEMLGKGYTPEYYEQTVVNDMRWFYREGVRDGKKRKAARKEQGK